MASRRAFLTALGSTAVAAQILAKLQSIESGFASSLTGLEAASLNPTQVRERYLLSPDIVYLNHASIGTVPRAVHEARVALQLTCEQNPWLYIFGGAWEEAREEVRSQAAALLGCSSADVAITHNTTEGFNLLAQGLPLGPGDEVLYSSMNHDGASVCWHHMASERGYSVRSFAFPVGQTMDLSVQDVVDLHMEQVRSETRVLVFPHIDNMVGLRHPLGALTEAAHAAGVEFVLVDGAQSAGMIPLDLVASGVDGYAASPHKWIQSPKGLGLLYLTPAVREQLRPGWVTWGQQRWAGTVRIFEDYGTRDMPEVLALGDALRFQSELGESAKTDSYRERHTSFQRAVNESPGLRWRSPRDWELGSCLMAIEPVGAQAPEVQQRLYREHGIVVRAFGASDLNTLRVSPNVATTAAELGQFLDLAIL